MSIRSTLTRIAITGGAALAVGACASGPKYQSVPAGQPAAEMRFLRTFGDPGFGGGATQQFALSADENCESVQETALFNWATSGENVLRVTADTPTIIWAHTNYLSPGSMSVINGAAVGTLNEKMCSSAVTFTPLLGHTYDVRQPSMPRNPVCPLEIIDRATGAPAPGVKVQADPKCRPPVKPAD
jgi:hypothetical protein